MSALRAAAVTVLMALVATLLTVTSAVPTADAQLRAECGDGPGNALNQLRDNAIDAILGEISDWIQDHPWEPEGIDEFYDRCAGDLPTGPPPGYDQSLPGSPPGRRGSSSGDPHIVTQDGVRYDFHGSGDFTLLETLDGSTTMHIRFRGAGPASLFEGVAVESDGVRFSMNTFQHGELAEFYIEDRLIELPANGWYDLGVGHVLHYDNVFTVRLDNGLMLLAQRSGMSLFTPESLAGEFGGLHGNGNGDPGDDLATRAGTLIDGSDSEQLYGEYFSGWAVAPDESLFAVPGNLAQPPASIVTLGDLDPVAVEAAATICAQAGLAAGEGLDECIFDIALTGDPVWAEDIPSAAKTPAIPAGLLAPSSEPSSLDALTTVEGSFDDETASYFTVAAADVERTLRVRPPCLPYGAAVASIVADGNHRSVSLTCDTVIAVPSEAFELRLANPAGLQSDFAFTLGEVDRVDLGTIESGTTLTGSLQPGDLATGRLDFAADSRIFLDAGPVANCAVTIRITNATGDEILPATSGCLDRGPIFLDGPAPFTLHATTRTSSDYDVTITAVGDDVSNDTAVGEEVALTVTTAGQTASATAAFQVGDRFYVETLESIPGVVRVLGPDDVELAQAISVNDLGVVEVTAAGDHTVIFEPNNASTGTQLVRVSLVADDTALVTTVGETIDLQITSPGQRASLALDLAAGERIYVETLASMDGDLVFTGSSGVVVRALALNDLGLVQADTAGPYSIIVAGRGAATGTQSLLVHAVAPDSTAQASVGDEVDLVIETPGQIASVEFDLDAGDTVVISNIQEIAGTLEITGPDGTLILRRPSQLEVGEIQAESSGTYRITLRGDGATTGTQTLAIDPA